MDKTLSLRARQKFGHSELEQQQQQQQQCWLPSHNVNKDSLSQALKRCTVAEEARLLHTLARTHELDRSGLVGNLLVDAYARCGLIQDARQAFDNLRCCDVVSWTILIGAYAHNGQSKQAVILFRKMQRDGVQPDRVTFINVIAACAACGDLTTGKCVHARVVDSGLLFQASSAVVATALLTMYGRCRELQLARQLFDQHKHLHHDPILWNALIAAYAQNGYFQKAVELYQAMDMKGVGKSRATFVSVLSAVTNAELLDTGVAVQAAAAACGFEKDTVVGAALISMYARCSRLEEARSSFDRIARPNVVSWSALVAAYAQNGEAKSALAMYREMKFAKVVPNKVTFVSLVDACTLLGDLAEGRAIHRGMVASQIDAAHDLIVGNALVNLYGKCGSLQEAKHVFWQMKIKDVVSWSSLMAAFAQKGLVHECLEYYRQMLLQGTAADAIVYVSLLSSCSLSGLTQLARDVFHWIRADAGILPTPEHFTCMVDLLGRAGRLAEAEDVLESMPYYPSPLAYVTLLGACKMYTDVERAERAAGKAYMLEPRDGSPYVTLASILDAAGRPEEAEQVREALGKRQEQGDLNSSSSRRGTIDQLSLVDRRIAGSQAEGKGEVKETAAAAKQAT